MVYTVQLTESGQLSSPIAIIRRRKDYRPKHLPKMTRLLRESVGSEANKAFHLIFKTHILKNRVSVVEYQRHMLRELKVMARMQQAIEDDGNSIYALVLLADAAASERYCGMMECSIYHRVTYSDEASQRPKKIGC